MRRIPDFGGIYRALKWNTPLKPTFPDFCLKDGLLFYKSYCVVPEKLHIPVIQAWHGESVHAGAASLYADLRRRYWREGLSEKCKQVSRHCPICQAVQPPHQAREGFLLPDPVPDRIMTSMSLDTFPIGPAKDDPGRLFDGVLLCVFRLSGAVICEPILFNGFTGEKAGKMSVKQCFSVYDVPTEIITDHDNEFTSAWLNTLCAGLGISIAYTEVFRSQTNGRAEVAGH